MKKASIISVGNEILAGLTVDTNAVYLRRRLQGMGIPTVSSFSVGDDVDSIAEALDRACSGSDIVLVTGGLGPTDDDLTRQGLAKFMGVELEFCEDVLREISGFFASRGIEMADKNRVQAYIPAGASVLKNGFGTACGIMAEFGGKVLVCMPGVPLEMEQMFSETVVEKLECLGDGEVMVTRKLRCFGAGESRIAEMLGNMMQRGRNPLINCTVKGGIITLHIVARGSSREEAEVLIERDKDRLCEILGDLVYGCDDATLAWVVGIELWRHKKTLAVAESCTGGLLGKMLTDTSGASGYFTCGWISYSDESKTRSLGVDSELIRQYGAVSAEVASAMAACARQRSGSDYAIGITGIAGPGGGSDEKPVGLVYIAVNSADDDIVREYLFPHCRANIRVRACLTALNMLRFALQDLTLKRNSGIIKGSEECD